MPSPCLSAYLDLLLAKVHHSNYLQAGCLVRLGIPLVGVLEDGLVFQTKEGSAEKEGRAYHGAPSSLSLLASIRLVVLAGRQNLRHCTGSIVRGGMVICLCI